MHRPKVRFFYLIGFFVFSCQSEPIRLVNDPSVTFDANVSSCRADLRTTEKPRGHIRFHWTVNADGLPFNINSSVETEGKTNLDSFVECVRKAISELKYTAAGHQREFMDNFYFE